MLAGLFAALVVSAVLGWRFWNAPRAESSDVATHDSAAPSATVNDASGTVQNPAPTVSSASGMSATPVTAGMVPVATTSATVPGTPPKRSWDYGYFNSLTNAAPGAPVRFELSPGNFASGIIQHLERTNGELVLVSGDVNEPEAGRFSFRKQTLPGIAGDYSGEVIFPASKTAFRIEPTGPGGKSELVPRALDEVLCLTLPAIDPSLVDTNAVEEIPPLRPDQVPDYFPAYNEGIISLQSLPGATGVIYLDYRGGYTPTWGGITYEKPVVTSAQIRDVWKRVSEDYMPFKVNVTTDIKVYQAAPENSRQRCVLTPTTTAAPGAGGVAFLRDWNNTGDRPCWSFYYTGKNASEAVAHEIGHTLWLQHDGRSSPVEGYYEGQGSGVTGWAPIMGVGYYQPVAQWSKGEYANANNLEDDLSIIVNNNNNVAYRADDTGATLATSRYLEVFSGFTASAEGVIETTGDTDAFRFTTSGGVMSLTINPVGDWADLAVMASLADGTGALIATNNPQNVLSASIVTNLPAGTYTFRVTGVGRNDPLTTGFSAYASLGFYSITGSVAGATLSTRFNLGENATNGTVLGTVTATNLGVDALNYAIISGNISNTFALDNNGILTVINAGMLDYEKLALNSQFAPRLEMFVNITNTVNPALTELNRRLVVLITNVNEAPTISGFTNILIAHTQPGTLVGNISTGDQDFYTVLTLTLLSGNTGGMFAFDATTGNLTVAGDPDPATQSVYNLAFQVADNGSPNLRVTNYVQISVVTNASPYLPGTISYSTYDNIGSGVAIINLTTNSRFPTDATAEKQISSAEGDTGRGTSYGAVMRGYLIPPTDGNYTFFIATDDNGELWLSPTTNPASMTRIAEITGASAFAGVRQWDKYSSQKSAPQALIGGRAYYLEARQKQGGSSDNFAVGWSGPASGNLTNVIPGTYLAPYFLNYVPRVAGFTNSVRRDAITGIRVGQVTKTDLNTNDVHVFDLAAGNVAGIFSIDNTGLISVANDAALAASVTTNFVLTVRATDNGTPRLSGSNTVTLKLIEAGVISATSLQREIFTNIGSSTFISGLTGNSKYPGKPDVLVAMSSFATPTNFGDNYGSRIRAYLVPSVTGDYRFFIASDDSSQLKFSRDTNAANAAVIASVTGLTGQNVWTNFASQTSALFTNLVAGQRYYIETLHKEAAGNDHISAGWSLAGSGVTNVIPAANLQPADINISPAVGNLNLGLLQSVTNGATVATVTASDSPLDRLTFKLLAGNTNNTFAINPLTGVITVADNAQIASGALTFFPLLIQVQDSGYDGLYPLRSSNSSVSISIISTNTRIWDANTGTTGKQDGNGNWGGATPNWWTGFGNAVWTDGFIAVFGSGTATNCTVTVLNDVTPAGIVFNQNNGGTYALADGGGALILDATSVINASADATISTVIKGTGLVKTGPGKLSVTGTNVYSGPTAILGGSLIVNGVLTTNAAGTVTVATNATLGGTGLIQSLTLVQNGGSLAPGGAGFGQLTISNDLNLAAGARTVVKLSKTDIGLTNDLLAIAGTWNLGGTLTVTNTGTNVLAGGDSFTVFNLAATTGGFAGIVLPALTNGLNWNTNALFANGTLSVAWDTFTLIYTSGPNGTISGSASQVVNYGDSGSPVTAVANSGYAFTNWSDGLTSNPRTDANVTSNLAVAANFVTAGPTPPLITSLTLAPGQATFALSGTGTAGQSYVLFSTTNLPALSWLPIATNPAGISGLFIFTNLETTNFHQRFYRVMEY